MTARLNTEYETALGAVERVNLEFESFCRSVSHELRGPMRAIGGLTEALLEDYDEKLDEKGKEYLRYLDESARRLPQLVDGLLALARSAHGELHRTRVDLTAVASRILDQLRAAAPDRLAEFVVEGCVTADGDAGLLEIALANLLGNAWKFTSKRSRTRIEFGTRQDETSAVYFVRDNGTGFDMRNALKVFGTFERLHSTKDFEGTGVGLALVQRIIHRHGGRVWSEGEVDRGATFYFTLPAIP